VDKYRSQLEKRNMSRRIAQRNWLPASVIFGITLCLTASNFRTKPPAESTRAARIVAISPALASLAPHPGHSASYPRHRYIVQSQSSELARGAVSQAGGIVTGDLSVIRAVAAALDEHEMAALRAARLPLIIRARSMPQICTSAA
jgi:hypothetical protein